MLSHRDFLVSCAVALALALLGGPARAGDTDKEIIRANGLLGRGINLGNALEAPTEGAWGLTLEADFFDQIKKAGFDSVRLPVRWSAHAGKDAPYTIDATFFRRVDWAIDQALSRDLAVVLNVHHYEEMFKDPEGHLPRLLGLWKQIAQRYSKKPDRLFFELINEPHDKLTDERWVAMVPRLLEVVRASNPSRPVVIGPGGWNNLNHLDKLKLPASDRRIIVTFHYYSPFEFTHQGASWVQGSDKWKGKTWAGSAAERNQLAKDFEKAAAWGRREKRPLYLGEFGAYSAADMASRARWTAAVVAEAKKHGFSWAYWEFASGFGAYDPKAKAWRQPLLDALLGSK